MIGDPAKLECHIGEAIVERCRPACGVNLAVDTQDRSDRVLFGSRMIGRLPHCFDDVRSRCSNRGVVDVDVVVPNLGTELA